MSIAKLGIIGAGAMGCLLAHYLSRSTQVWLLDPWQAQVAAITSQGLACDRDGVETHSTPQATSDPQKIGACDAVLVLVKAHQTPWAAEQARILAGPQTVTFTLQNGVGNRETLAELLGEAQIGQAVTSLGATLLEPGRIRHAGMGPTVVAAQPDRKAAQALIDLFSQSGLPATLSDDLATLVWGKLIINVGINALTALLRVPNGVLAEQPAATALVARVVAEAVAVAQAGGIQLPYEHPLEHVLAVARATAANRSSTLQDVLRGSPTEIATINGAISREGARLGIPTPANDLITQLVQALDATATQRL